MATSAAEMGYLEDALEAEHGVKLILESPEDMRRMQQRLYKTRTTDERYSNLVLSQQGRELWILRKEES